MSYKLILADPPWNYQVWSKKGAGRTAEAHYPTMRTADICTLPVKGLADRDSVLLIWATWPNLLDALLVINAWGFRYVTAALLWVKLNKSGAGVFRGLGHYSRSNTEPLLLAKRGRGLPRKAKDVGQVLITPRREHSRKPDEQYGKIARLFGDVPRVELFARHTWPGWDSWGHGVTGEMLLSVFAEQREERIA
jgi:N6-adenosine-specific RNA methylase IME4